MKIFYKFLDPKKDIKIVKDFKENISSKFPLLSRFLGTVFILIKWMIILFIVVVLISALIGLGWLVINKITEKVVPGKTILREEIKVIQELNSPIQLSSELYWSIDKVYERGTSFGDRYNSHQFTTNGKFIEMVISVENLSPPPVGSIWITKDKQTYPTFRIKDSSGRWYNEYRRLYGIGYSSEYDSLTKVGYIPIGERDYSTKGNSLYSTNLTSFARNEIKPALPYRFFIIFEMAEDSNGPYLLEIRLEK